MTEREQQSVSQHILGTSANLPGICFAIFTMIRALNIGESTYIDELAVTAVFFFLGSCLFSYASMRSRKRWILYEKIADLISSPRWASCRFLRWCWPPESSTSPPQR